ncbi:MSHA biogenesis protein MshI [Lacimicrobium sp. SS2-24]|uniref:MSHA biogenesis protein MshI n=1 Tax=Lacimicrobium sp. SS2-24 TaxID=2005569 RepID=UPI000B4B19F8|nr:MSHA biogenesis protein MshI [Lacimicrobium sp. SS2-24]
MAFWDTLTGKFSGTSRFFAVGIEFGQQALLISVLTSRQGRLFWAQQHRLDINNWQRSLADWVKQHQAANTPCHVVFSTNRYQIMQVDRPAVEEQELTQALRWSAKELLASSEEMAVDYFDMPAQPTGSNKLNLVTIPQSLIQSVSQGILQSGLILKSLGIEELSQCDVLEPQEYAQITLLQEPGEEISLSIIRQQQLYFTRRLKGYEQLSTYSIEQIQQGIAETLSLEVQRSMDYFESQLRQAPAKQMLICMDTPFAEALSQSLQQMLMIETHLLEIDIDKEPELSFSPGTITSLGAALRQRSEADA